MKSGIYIITNLRNGKIYIGSAMNLQRRWQLHLSRLNRNVHKNKYLQNSWNKYGSEYFDFEPLEYCEIENLIEREQYYLDLLKPYLKENGYNVSPTAGSNLGYKHSEASKLKQVLAQYGKISTIGPMSLEARINMSLAQSNRKNNHTIGNKYRRQLSDQEVREIRANKYMYQRELAKKYGINQRAIWDIIHYKTYKDVK